MALTQERSYSALDDVQLVGKVREAILSCSHRREDGTFYADHRSVRNLRKRFRELGINATVTIDGNSRFAVHLGEPAVFDA